MKAFNDFQKEQIRITKKHNKNMNKTNNMFFVVLWAIVFLFLFLLGREM